MLFAALLSSCGAKTGLRVPDVTHDSDPCFNGIDDNLDGEIDEGCPVCIHATTAPWAIHRSRERICFGQRFTVHGDPAEYAFESIPAENASGWSARTALHIDFSDPSALCGAMCDCLDGAEFTYFQTFVDVPSSVAVRSLEVRAARVDDGVRVTLFNSLHPAGVRDPGGFATLDGSSLTARLAPFVAPGRNRIVLTHVDDCCRFRVLDHVTVTVNDAPLVQCVAR